IESGAFDTDRASEFRAIEMRMARFNEDWPLPFTRNNPALARSDKPNDKGLFAVPLLSVLPLNFWDAKMWAGTMRFWLGWAYSLLSDFGRSVIRPVLAWALLVAIFTCVYLSGHLDYDARSAALTSPPALGWVGRQFPNADITYRAWSEGFACVETDRPDIIALKPEVREGTDAFWQAFRMSVANGVVVGDLGGAEGARLAYGCLFGLERLQPARSVSGSSVDKQRQRSWFSTPYLPPDILWATRIQKGLSAILLFLFGLGLRNMLKLR
ncbi:MAG: hypothetical protein AAFO62_09520, partial [Pseudomonadota bacterium]